MLTFYNGRAAAPQFQVLSGPEYRDVQDRLRGAADVAAFVRIFPTLGGDQPIRLQGEMVSDNYFRVLGAAAFLGRLPDGRDTDSLAGRSAVLSYDLWQRRFGGRGDIIGRVVRLDRIDYAIVAVTAPRFSRPRIPRPSGCRSPPRSRCLTDAISCRATTSRSCKRLPGRSTDCRRCKSARESHPSERPTRMAIGPHRFSGDLPSIVAGLWATLAWYLAVFATLAGCVLFVACANLAGLLVVRSAERGRELTLRLVLGATRTQLLRRLLMESLILAISGGMLGAIGAYNLAPLLEHAGVPVPARVVLTADPRLLVISALVSTIAASLFSIVFAIAALKSGISRTLAVSAPTISSRSHLQRALVVGQVAVGCMLLIGAGL